MIRKLATTAAAAAAAIVLGALTLAPTARADVADTVSCPTGSLCVYSGQNLTGTRTVVPARMIEERRDAGYTITAPVLSIANRTGFDVLHGVSHPVVCIRFPCYQYTVHGRVDAGRDLASADAAGQPLVVGRDYGR
ncbi:peptidase inhibitor family I36 protein [Embleya sp. NPDC050154]|uniref:peptidase inhibitor family I36 protein n=1 Tax=Embleya sp. NPDC050154 TaxID=3363988 RepID=UPI0037B6DDE1